MLHVINIYYVVIYYYILYMMYPIYIINGICIFMCIRYIGIIETQVGLPSWCNG